MFDYIYEVLAALVVTSENAPSRLKIVSAHSINIGAQSLLKRLPNPELTIKASCRLILALVERVDDVHGLGSVKLAEVLAEVFIKGVAVLAILITVLNDSFREAANPLGVCGTDHVLTLHTAKLAGTNEGEAPEIHHAVAQLVASFHECTHQHFD